jgi:LDH2 family malate/lactate/ureidoglycolate dehydrogenase
MLTSNGGPAMALWGGRTKIIGTNPWSVAAPVGTRAPFVVDMAATGVARGKIYLARHEHRPIPLGWALNQAGEPTTGSVTQRVRASPTSKAHGSAC